MDKLLSSPLRKRSVFMLYAYDPNDKLKHNIHIDDWVVRHHKADGCCKICHESVFVKGLESQKKAHFSHYPNSSCPLITSHHKPYEHLKNIPRDDTLIPLRKDWLKKNVYEVYYKIKKEFPNLCFTWKDFELSVKSANDINVWALKDMPMDYIPYILLVSVSKYPKTKIRKNEYFYVLETLQRDTSYSPVFWNDSELSKKIIWEVKVSTSTNTVTEYDINLETAIPPYVKKIIDLL